MSLDELISRLNTAKKKKISELENMAVESSKLEYKQKKKNLKYGKEYPELCHNYQSCHIHIIGISEGKEKAKGQKKYLR